ncbi:serine/threonine protein kinase [Cordyceps fumosorosea ARSEF 2679]|uniref:non-specific serine/threonine protein kinase n=1 Tax=Cordyceps fumosorosea (strain ARSEF 2679) TaxID=1081104 RepID=A0A168ES20_CORFA|nr:serine/threonine protein kinase [Cordyceps fumosorosea ARSEF 2679]OAA74145.1 serine/threonine protein kinase [Cordyceps fumosorosea ARSEF 2679]
MNADSPLSGGNNTNDDGERGRGKLLTPLSLPKNLSTGNLALSADPDRTRFRMSFEGSSSAAHPDHDLMTRPSPVADHEHGLGLSGLRRIRQHPPSRNPTMPNSNASSRSPSVVTLSRSTSMSATLAAPAPLSCISAAPASPSFSEDLSRFPTESLHSFSFAHQSEDFLHNRQNVLKRSLEFIKDRLGQPLSANQAGLASAQARLAGDLEAQNMLEMLAKAQIIGASNLPNPDASFAVPPLTGPADVSGENIFEKQFTPHALSEEPATIHEEPEDLALSPTFTRLLPSKEQQDDSQKSSRTPTDESKTTATTSPPTSRPTSLKRTMTDTLSIALKDKLMDTMAQPFMAGPTLHPEPSLSPVLSHQTLPCQIFPGAINPAVHGHTNRWVPAAQAIFTTEAKPPWTILAANDLACLVFGVTKAEVRKMGILEVVQEERRAWLERKLLSKDDGDSIPDAAGDLSPASSAASALLGGRPGITAQLLSKPNSRSQTPQPPRRAQTIHSGDVEPPKLRGADADPTAGSRGVLLCGDVVPIQKRNGLTGSASLWVKEKQIGLIWVLEEIHEDVAHIEVDEDGVVKAVTGATETIWGFKSVKSGIDIANLIPRIPRQGFDPTQGEIDFAQTRKRRYFTCPNYRKVNIPCTVEQIHGKLELRVSTFPHMAGIIVVDPTNFNILSSNSAFSGALFGFEKPAGTSINALIPGFDKIVETLTEEDGLQLLDGMVIPEHRFRRAAAFTAIKQHKPNAAASFLQPNGLAAKHRDGSDLNIDVQMRVVESERQPAASQDAEEAVDDAHTDASSTYAGTEMVFALWLTYSRHVHAVPNVLDPAKRIPSGPPTPLHQPSPGQTPVHSPMVLSDTEGDEPRQPPAPSSGPSRVFDMTRIKDATVNAAARLTGQTRPQSPPKAAAAQPVVTMTEEEPIKATINDYVILEDMGQGAYGQVKLARNKRTGRKMVLKYVTKRRILVDTWTRDRRLGTVPLEIHVLDFLRKPEFRHPNIVEMENFFEDDVNYYIAMVPHGLPGMDLFDYIELRSNMDEAECRSIFVQVAQAVHFLHTKAMVVHRDIKDENIILDGEGNIKLIDFGSAAYIRSGPFDVFVGTIDYAAPEVLAGQPYDGKPQDVWALGILLYTIIYKENPFYSIDEIMDRDLRLPFTMSPESIDLIRCMLSRLLDARMDISQVLDHPWCKGEVSSQ